MSCGSRIAITVGSELPAMSISYVPPTSKYDSGYVVFFAAADPRDDEEAAMPVCLHCLVEDGDEQLAQGLEQARRYGHVDWDPGAEEWFTPEDRAYAGELGWDAALGR